MLLGRGPSKIRFTHFLDGTGFPRNLGFDIFIEFEILGLYDRQLVALPLRKQPTGAVGANPS